MHLLIRWRTLEWIGGEVYLSPGVCTWKCAGCCGEVRSLAGNLIRRLVEWIIHSCCSIQRDDSQPAFTMSKGGTLRVKSLFKLKSSDKDKEHKQSGYFRDAAGDTFSSPPQSPGPVSPGGSATLAGDSLPLSPRAKKGLRLLFRSKKAKKKDAEGEVFSDENDEMDSFSRWDCCYYPYYRC